MVILHTKCMAHVALILHTYWCAWDACSSCQTHNAMLFALLWHGWLMFWICFMHLVLYMDTTTKQPKRNLISIFFIIFDHALTVPKPAQNICFSQPISAFLDVLYRPIALIYLRNRRRAKWAMCVKTRAHTNVSANNISSVEITCAWSGWLIIINLCNNHHAAGAAGIHQFRGLPTHRVLFTILSHFKTSPPKPLHAIILLNSEASSYIDIFSRSEVFL